jgi:hypothetical protein
MHVRVAHPGEPVMNKLVARFADGSVVKGATLDFAPEKDVFHMTVAIPAIESTPLPIRTEELKALFFVKDFAGDPLHVEQREFDSPPPPGGRRIMAAFKDGEILVGSTMGYREGLPGFFMVPADAESNNRRCYVVATATREIRFL